MNIVSTLAGKLGGLLTDEYKLQEGVKEQVKTVTKELNSVDAFLQGIDKVPPDQLGDQLKLYASEVREASYDMEDVLDTFLVRVQGPEPIGKKKKKKLIKRLREKMDSIFSISKTAARHNIATAINDIMKRLQEAEKRRGRSTVTGISQPSGSGINPRIKAMYEQVTEIIGIEKSRGELASLLSPRLGNEVSDNKLKIVSVVGVGGLGKTTLAKAVYDDLKGEFDCCAFVPIGRNPDPKKILTDILIALNKDKYTDLRYTVLDELQLIHELRDVLQDKRYFIVIDDVWDIKSWKTITCALVDNNKGSRIIVTTRNSEVATRDAYHQYKLRPLSDYDSKRLFYMRIFGAEDKCLGNQRHEVSQVADKILKKCGGVPLAIMTMGGYLEGKSIEEWLEVCNSTGFCGKDKEQTGDTEWILSLSYYDLPSHLKNCLLYLSVFPEDHLINRHALIWMWIAEGFVDNNGKSGAGLFEIGEGYFNKLINRSLIQPVEDEDSMIVKGCRVHDMILDLIRSLSHEEKFAAVLYNSEEISKGSNARRFALQNNTEVKDAPLDNSKRARSFITFNCNFAPRVNLRHFELLRMLYLEDSKNVKLDKHVGNLHHLRCLGICGDYDSSELPKEIGSLKFLLVLYLDHRKIRGLLPSSVGMLKKLVCLYAPEMYLPGCTIKDLRALQELCIYYICSPAEGDRPWIWSKGEGEFVKDLCNLIELRVFVINCGNMFDRSVYSELLTSVGNLHKLQHLDIGSGSNKGLPSFIDSTHFSKLSHLSLEMYSLSDQDLEILGGLPKLSYLCLDGKWVNAKLTGTTACGYFKELRSFLLPSSMVQFVVNEEDSSVSVAIWRYVSDALPFGSKTKQDNCRAARPVMPNLEALVFQVEVGNGFLSCDNLGLEYLSSLQKVKVHHARDSDAGADAKNQVADALRHTIQVHPNRPTLSLEGDWWYGPKVNRWSGDDDDDVAEEEDEQ